MTTAGRIAATVLVAAVLMGLTYVAARFLQAPTSPATPPPESPPGPDVVVTPGAGAAPAGTMTAKVEARTDGAPPAAGGVRAPAAGAAQASGGEPVAAAAAGAAAAGSAVPGDALSDEGLAMMRDRPFDAQKRLSQALRAGVGGGKVTQVHAALAALAEKLQLSDQRAATDTYSKAYQVASGDSLIAIGRRFQIPHELVMRLNRISTPAITAGQTLKVIQGPLHVEVLKGRRELQLWLDQVCLKVYPVAIGAKDKTPEGTFVVKNKLVNPPYQPQHKSKVEFREGGAPDNPLGTRWIDIGNHYGIHGTIDPTSIGRDVSEGCIRMHNKDVEEVFSMLVPGASKVIIRP